MTRSKTFRNALIASAAAIALSAPAAIAQENAEETTDLYEQPAENEKLPGTPEDKMTPTVPTPDVETQIETKTDIETDVETATAEEEAAPEKPAVTTAEDKATPVKPGITTADSSYMKEEMYVTASALNVRADAGIQAEKVDLLQNGEQVIVHKMENGWARISAEGEEEQFVSAQYLSDIAPTGQGGPEADVEETVEKPAEETRMFKTQNDTDITTETETEASTSEDTEAEADDESDND